MHDARRRAPVPCAHGGRPVESLESCPGGGSQLSGVTVGVALDRVLPPAHALRSITVPNLCPVPWKIGRINAASNWFHSTGQALKMRSSNP
jgi:hypothetical protein